MKYIIYEKRDGIAFIRFNRPEKYNSFIREMALELQSALDDAEIDELTRVIVLTGTGKAFCAGQDLKEATSDNGIDIHKIIVEHYNPIIRRLRKIEKPVIAAVNGVAAGAGANIAIASDIVIAKESARFIQAFSLIGLIPDSGGTYFLPRLIGAQRALALMMTGDAISAMEAKQIGMIYQVYPDEEFEERSFTFARKMAHMPTKALGLIKKAINQSLDNSLDEQLSLEDEYQKRAAATLDYAEGAKAFLEKRKPKFLGK
jgi:2-(1,2-epoxy-1,2-dihydrophenyl)acetyl-CoA isomerase